jgi:3-oxoadipate enol-lactonase
MRVTTTAGPVHLARAGDGPPALLLHGIGSSADSFRAQLDGLSGDHCVMAWDAPGYARSGDPAGELTLDDYARTAVEVLDALEVERVHLAGVSWGGVVATRVALNHPARVSTLALIASTPGRRGTASVGDLERRCRLLERVGPAEFARRRAGRVLRQPADPELRAEVERNMAASVRLAGYRSAGASLAATRHAGELGAITAPALVIVGRDDGVTGLGESELLAEQIPRAGLMIIEGAGHLVNQERPERVNAALHEHWQRRE